MNVRHEVRRARGSPPPEMMARTSREFLVSVSAPMAFFGDTRTGASNTSHLLPSHDGAVGILRGVLGTWEMTWNVSEVRMQKIPSRMALTCNEIKSFGSEYQGLIPKPIDALRQRTQRTTVCLRDVHLIIRASISLTKYAGEGDTIDKYERWAIENFRTGRRYRPIYLGRSEFGAVDIEHVTDSASIPPPANVTKDFGLRFFGQDHFGPDPNRFYYAPLQMVRGVLRYPSWEQVREYGNYRVIRRVS